MLLDTIFDSKENQAIGLTLHRLLTHSPCHLTLTGSIALQIHCNRRTPGPLRHFGDIDMIVETLGDLPASLTDDFICLHVHPLAKQGDLLLQLVNAHDAIRFDVFRSIGNALNRSHAATFGPSKISVISCEDLMAKTTALLLKLCRGGTVAAKHAQDFTILLSLISDAIEDVWQEYRTDRDPPTFREAASYVATLIITHSHALIKPAYNKDVSTRCPKCQSSGLFKPAKSRQVFRILGYI